MTAISDLEKTSVPPCPKCNSRVSRVEKDILGSVRTCALCGHCTYMDQEGLVIEGKEAQENMTTDTDRATEEPNQAAPTEEENQATMPEGITDLEKPKDEEDGAEPAGPEDGPGEEEEPQPPDRCGNCQATPGEAGWDRFQRLPARQCSVCGGWELNPWYEGDLTDRDEEIGVIIQLMQSGNSTGKVIDLTKRLLNGKTISTNTPGWWTKSIITPAALEAQKLKARTGEEWSVKGMPLNDKNDPMWAWAVADNMTQYILSISITKGAMPEERLIREATEKASVAPSRIILMEGTPAVAGVLKKQLKDCIFIKGGTDRKPNQSLERLMWVSRKRMESNRSIGNMKPESIRETIAANTISINLFEQSPDLAGRTPAEAAGVQAPFSNWAQVSAEKKGSRKNEDNNQHSRKDDAQTTTDTGSPVTSKREAKRNTTNGKKPDIIDELENAREKVIQEKEDLRSRESELAQDQWALERSMEIIQENRKAAG